MSKSNRLRLRDARDIYLLVGECREVGEDIQAWRQRMHDGLAELLSSRVIVCGMLPRDDAEPWKFATPDAKGVFAIGWRDADDKATFEEYWDRQMVWTDPTFQAMQSLPQSLLCRRRCELVSDAVWFRSPHFNDFIRRWGVDDCIFSQMTPNPKSGVARMFLTVGRDIGRRRLSVRERRVLTLFCREIRGMLGETLMSPYAVKGRPLPPRLRQVLELLLTGDSEKQIAQKLFISPHTVHSHIKRLHERFDVSSRGELLARCRNWPRM